MPLMIISAVTVYGHTRTSMPLSAFSATAGRSADVAWMSDSRVGSPMDLENAYSLSRYSNCPSTVSSARMP